MCTALLFQSKLPRLWNCGLPYFNTNKQYGIILVISLVIKYDFNNTACIHV